MNVCGLFPVLTVEILEVGQLDSLPHAQHVRGRAKAIEQHPQIASIQSRYGVGGFRADLPNATQSVLDICPSGDDGADYHQSEGEESHGRDGAAKPEDLAICNQNDGQVLEDGVYWNGEELEGFGAGVDHANEEERDGEPYCQVSTHARHTFQEERLHFLASSVLKSR